MKQVLQDPRSGELAVTEVPAPKLLPGSVVVRIAASLVSAGTERAVSEFASKNLLQKAKARPDLVREVLAKIQRDGLLSAVAAVRSRLDQPSALGYSSAGTVVEVGAGITDLKPGDPVACAGAGYAVHAEFACVPRLLVAKTPADVKLDHAAFTTVGAVAMHGVRTAEVKLGDVVAVIGLGLLGQLTVQILKAAGCQVLGMDLVAAKCELAARLGADGTSCERAEFHDLCRQQNAGQGVDSVLIAAESEGSGPVTLAGEIARDRAVIVAVGAVGMEIPRRTYYEKELDFRIARSYGPGRYDSAFEQKGRDYPIGYVRWTETRNMESFLNLIACGKLNLEALITHRFPVDQARSAYDLITGKSGEQFVGVLITYPELRAPQARVELPPKTGEPRIATSSTVKLGLLGTGAFATGTLLPALHGTTGVELVGACAATGAHAQHAADKFGFRYCTTREEEILSDPSVNTVVITTRHHLHARQVLTALAAGKHVFCEKPLCLGEDELTEIIHTYDSQSAQRPLLMVGFNRRFAAMAVRLKSFLKGIEEPLSLSYRVNAGYIPRDHWVNDPEQGGGRILGEVCHFVDFLMFLADSPPREVSTRSLGDDGKYSGDNVVISLQFANSSQGTITYVASGDRTFSKERLEVFGGGCAAVLEDFRRLELVRQGKKEVVRSRLRQDKGHSGEWQAFCRAITSGGESPIPFQEIVAATLATLRAERSRLSGHPEAVRNSAELSAGDQND